jgi:hypothetical protein
MTVLVMKITNGYRMTSQKEMDVGGSRNGASLSVSVSLKRLSVVSLWGGPLCWGPQKIC